VSHDHIGIMLAALLTVQLPAGFTSTYQERYDPVIEHTFRDVTISPDGVDPTTFRFGTPGAYAYISVADDGDTYHVGVYATRVGYYVQSAGHVVAYTTAEAAVRTAVSEIRGHLPREDTRAA
jgi:hypothetical protein